MSLYTCIGHMGFVGTPELRLLVTSENTLIAQFEFVTNAFEFASSSLMSAVVSNFNEIWI